MPGRTRSSAAHPGAVAVDPGQVGWSIGLAGVAEDVTVGAGPGSDGALSMLTASAETVTADAGSVSSRATLPDRRNYTVQSMRARPLPAGD